MLCSVLFAFGCANNPGGPTDRTDAATEEDAGDAGGSDAQGDASDASDSAVPDIGTDDTGAPDLGADALDTGTSDTGTADTGIPDTGMPDMGMPDVPPPPCGGVDEPCCADGPACDGILICNAGFCSPCGIPGAPCCEGSACNLGLVCQAGMCAGCGAVGEACCAGTSSCETGATCSGGSCRACGVEPGTCMPGDVDTESCGTRCGIRTRICQATCAWGPWTACAGEGECAAGAMESMDCGMCGTETRSCGADCRWGTFGACSGEGECTAGETLTTGCIGPCQARQCSSACGLGDCTRENPACSDYTAACFAFCNAGYHPTRARCETTCGECTPGSWVNRITRCEPDSGSSYSMCLICNTTDGCSNACGPGYHVDRIRTGSSIDRNNCGLNDINMVTCRRNTDSRWTQCGTECPPGAIRSDPVRDTSRCNAAAIEANVNIPNSYSFRVTCDPS